MRIEKCDRLRSLAVDGPSPPTLRVLSIINCKKRQSLFVDGVPATLLSLTIRGCPELKSIPHGLCHSTSLLRLNIDYSPQLQSGELPSLSENSASLPMAWLRNLTSLQEWKMED